MPEALLYGQCPDCFKKNDIFDLFLVCFVAQRQVTLLNIVTVKKKIIYVHRIQMSTGNAHFTV